MTEQQSTDPKAAGVSMTRTELFLAVARAVELDYLPAPSHLVILDNSVNLTFYALADGQAWAEHFALNVGTANLPSDDGARLIYSWHGRWVEDAPPLYVYAYPPLVEPVPAGVEGHKVGQRAGVAS